MFFYPIFDHHIYTGVEDKSNISSDKIFGYNIASTLSLIKMQNGEYFSLLFYAMMLYNDALNMHAGIGVCFISYN